VVRLGVDDATNIYEIRAALEGLAGRLFVQRATDDEIEALSNVVSDIERNSKDVGSVLAAKARFYDVLFDGARNPELSKVIGLLHRRIMLLRSLSLSMPNRMDTSIDELHEIVSAAKRRDADAVHELCVAHVRSAAEAALAGLRADDKSPV
jgi:DNA-binding GntR family transcriptional regulator